MDLIVHNKVVPAVNQVETNPFHLQIETQTFLHENGIQIQSWGRLPKGEGDVTNYNIVKDAIIGHDIIYVNLAGNLEAMAKNIVKAMQETGVKRIIAISSICIYKTPLQPFFCLLESWKILLSVHV